MKKYQLILLGLLISACTQSEEMLGPDGGVAVEKGSKNIVIDPLYSGLVNLPGDTGGVHTAHPLSSDTDAPLGYYAYVPSGYEDNEHEYPLIVFLHGAGEGGNSAVFPPGQLEKVLTHGPPKLIEEANWNPTFPCLVMSPQSEAVWRPYGVHRFIEYVMKTYRVNPQRIYLTGLSMGGRGCWFYEGEKAEKSYAAALVPICGRGREEDFDALLQTPIWAFHGDEDEIVKAYANNGSFQMVTQINNKNPKFDAKLTIFPGVGHNSWERTYDNTGMGDESLEYDPFDMSIYDWMFQYRKEL